MWLNATGEKITLQDILADDTIGEIKGLIPIITKEDVTISKEEEIVKYRDTTGGVISTNSDNGEEDEAWSAYLAFDGIEDGYYSALSKWNEAENYWLEYEFPQSVKAIYAKVRLANGSSTSGERMMKIQAFNEVNNIWEDLTQEETYEGYLANFPKSILALSSNKLYRRFRIYISSVGDLTGEGAVHSGVSVFQLYGIKTEDNSISKEEIEQKLISSSNLNIGISNAVNIDSLMERLMYKKETEDIILTNENIRNAVLNSNVALSKTVRLNPIVTEENIVKLADKKYQDNLGNIMYSEDDIPIEIVNVHYAWKAFNGEWIKEGWGDESWWISAASSFSIAYEFTEPVLAYKFKYQVSSATSSSYYIKFSVQGSNDGQNWKDLTLDHELSSYRAIETIEEVPTYNSNNINKYKMFRIYVKEKSELSEIMIGEFEIYGIKD